MTALAALLVLLGAATWILTRNDDESSSGGFDAGSATTPHERRLTEAPGARFMSIIVSDAKGNLASYMVGGKTEEFDTFAAAIADARLLTGPGDESFTDLLVLSFGDNDTLEVSYSRARNQFILGDSLFQPSANLAPMIGAVEQKFNNQ